MTGPQTENGYTRIANELLEAIIRAPFSKRELKIVMTVIRKTYGYNKKTDDMSGQQIADLTGIQRQHVYGVLDDLTARKVLLKQDGQYGQVIGLNKKYGEWLLVPKQDCSQNRTSAAPKTGSVLVPKQDIQKTTPKDNTKRHIRAAPKTGLPQDFGISERVREWAKRKGYSQLDTHLENFVLAAKAKGYRYADWDAALMNAIRNDWAKVGTQQPDPRDFAI